jgi:hypothetical protein
VIKEVEMDNAEVDRVPDFNTEKAASKEGEKKGEGLDMSLGDLVAAEKKKKYKKPEVPGEIKMYWIDDSSCTIKFPNESLCNAAYAKLKLSEPRAVDQTP